MPTPEQIAELYSRGELGAAKTRAYEAAVVRGLLPAPRPSILQLSNEVINADANMMSQMDADALSGLWLEGIGQDASGVGYFDNEKRFKGVDKLKRIQNMFQPGRNQDVLSKYDQFVAMDREKQLEMAESFDAVLTKEGLNNIRGTMEEIASSLLVLQNPFTEGITREREDAKIDATKFRLLQKDFMKMKSLYDQQVKSEQGKAFIQGTAETGVWDQAFYDSIPDDEKPFIAPAIQLYKATSKRNTVSEAAGAVAGGVWDIIKGSVQYTSEKFDEAVLSGGDIMGAKSWRDALIQIREDRKDVRTAQQALATKFEERGVAGKGFVGLAHSLPLMVSFMLPGGKATALAKLSRGQRALSRLSQLQKVVSSLPVAMATTSMARQFEGDMIERGVDPEVAGLVALPTAVVNMYVEKAALDKFLGIGKEKLAGVTQEFIAKRIIKGGAKGFATALAFESAEEIVQAYNEELVTQLGLGDVDLEQLNRTVVDTVAEIAPTMLWFAAAGGGMGGLRSMSVENYYDNSITNEVYKEKIREAQEGTTPEQRQAEYSRIAEEYRNAPEEDRDAVLRANGVRNVDEARAILDAELELLEESDRLVEEDIELSEADIERREEALSGLETKLRELGFDARIIEEFTGDAALDPTNVGRFIEGGGIDILETARDPEGVADHEVLHGAIEFGVVNEAELDILNRSTTQEQLNAVAKAYAADIAAGKETDLSEEALADRYKAWKALGTQEKGVMRKLMDFFSRLVNFVRSGEFKTAEDIFGSIEGRLRERAKTAGVPQVDRDGTSKQAKETRDEIVSILMGDADTLNAQKFSTKELDDVLRFPRRTKEQVGGRVDAESLPQLREVSSEFDVDAREVPVELLSAEQKVIHKAIENTGVSVKWFTTVDADKNVMGASDRTTMYLNSELDIKDLPFIIGHEFAHIVHKRIIKEKGALRGSPISDIEQAIFQAGIGFKVEDGYTESLARTEAVADMFGNAFANGKFQELIDTVSQVDKSLAQQLIDMVRNFISSLGALGAQLAEATDEAGIGLKVRRNIRKGLENIQPKQTEAFAKGKRVQMDAAEVLARSIQKKPDMSVEEQQAIVERAAPGIDFEFVKAQADAILTQAQTQFKKKLDKLSRIDIAKASSALRLRAEGTRIRRQGFVEGERLVRVTERIKQRQAAEAKRVTAKGRRKAKRIGAKAVENVQLTEDVAATLENVRSVVREALKAEDITEPGAYEAAYKEAMARVLQPLRRGMKHDGMRESAATRVNKIKAESTRVKTAEKLFNEVVALADKQREKQATKDLLNGIKKDLKAVKGQEKLNVLNVDRKIDADTEHFLRMVKDVAGLTKESAEQLASEMQADLENDVFSKESMGETFAKKWESKFPILGSRFFGGLSFDLRLGQFLPVLQEYGALYGMGLEELAGAAATLEARINAGQVKAGMNAKEFVESTKRITKGLLVGTASKNKKAAFRFSGRWTAPFNLKHRLLDFTRFASQKAREVGEDAIDAIMDRVQRGATVRDTHVREGLDSLAKALLEIYGGAGSFGSKVTDALMGSHASAAMKHIDALTQTHKEYSKYNLIDSKPLSKEQLLQIVAIWEQADIKGNLEGYTQEMIDAIKDDVLNEKDLEFLDWLREFYVAEGDALSEVTVDLFGTRANSPTENYMPVVADVKKLWSSTEVHGAPLTPPSLRDRQVHKRKMDYRVGVLSMFEDRIRRNANFIGFAKTGHELKRVFGDEALSEQMDMIHGDAAITGLYHHLTDVVTNTKAGGMSSKILEKMRGMVGLIALSGNFKVFFTQWTSLPAFALEEGLLDFSRGILNAAKDPRAWLEGMQALRNSEQWKNRRALGTSEFVENALRDSMGTGAFDDMIASNDVKAAARFLKRAVSTWYKSGMVTNAMGDAVPIFMYGPAIYMQKKAEALQDGLSDPDATQKALDRTWSWIQRTQQSYSPKDQSAWIRRGGSFARILAQFSTTPAQFLSYEMKAIRDLLANPSAKNWRQALNVIAVNHVLLAGGYFVVAQGISNFLRGDDWDDEDTKRLFAAMITGPGSGIVIGGALVQDYLDAAATSKASLWRGESIPMVAFMKRTGMDLGDLIKHMTYDFDLDEALSDTEKVMKDFSAPFRQISQTVEQTTE